KNKGNRDMAFNFTGVRYINNGEPYVASVLNRPIQDIVAEINSSLVELYTGSIYPWSAGSYVTNSFAIRNGRIWVARTTTTQTPSDSATQWDKVVTKTDLGTIELTGTPTAPTAPVGTNSSQIATT